MYFSTTQFNWPSMTMVVRTAGDPESALPVVRARLKEIDPAMPMANARTLDDWLHRATAQPRLQSTVLGAFSAMAFLLAAIGIYGVVSYSVTQRSAEIGVRMALGAARRDVLRMVMGQGMRLVAGGLAVGIAGSFALTRLIESLLFGVSARDPWTLAGAPAALALLALLACLAPAFRATRIEPVRALRCE
jgi:putative ABC transport system permease protein